MKTLIQLVSKIEHLASICGICTVCKYNQLHRGRIAIVLLILWLDVFYNIALLCFIPNTEEDLLIRFADLGFWIFGPRRYLLTTALICYRLSACFTVTMFYLDHFKWLRNANELYMQLIDTSNITSKRVERLTRRCQKAVVFFFLNSLCTFAFQHVLGLHRFPERNAKYFTWHIHFYNLSYSLISTVINSHAMVKVFFYSRLGSVLFDEINRKFIFEVMRKNSFDRFAQHSMRFTQVSLLVHHVNNFVRRAYVSMMVCYLPCLASFFYNAFYSDLFISVKVLQTVLLFSTLIYLLLIGRVIGDVDHSAKQISDPFYEQILFNPDIIDGHILEIWQFTQSHVFSSTVGLTVWGQPINVKTSIKIITAFLTVINFAFK